MTSKDPVSIQLSGPRILYTHWLGIHPFGLTHAMPPLGSNICSVPLNCNAIFLLSGDLSPQGSQGPTLPSLSGVLALSPPRISCWAPTGRPGTAHSLSAQICCQGPHPLPSLAQAMGSRAGARPQRPCVPLASSQVNRNSEKKAEGSWAWLPVLALSLLSGWPQQFSLPIPTPSPSWTASSVSPSVKCRPGAPVRIWAKCHPWMMSVNPHCRLKR